MIKTYNSKYSLTCKKCSQPFISYSPRHSYCEACKLPHECKCGCGELIYKPDWDYIKGHALKNKSKPLNFTHICVVCNTQYKSADWRGKWCVDCKKPRKCKCGCGKLVKTPGREFYPNHSKKGKTHKEIYGTNTPTCGFKKGKDNPMADIQILEKCLDSIKHKRVLYDNINFRSSWEVEIYKIIQEKYSNIQYEPSIHYPGGWLKPDFVVDNKIIEVSGFASAFKTSRDRNIKKIHIYLEHTRKDIIFIVDKLYSTEYYNEFKNNSRVKIYYYQDRHTLLEIL